MNIKPTPGPAAALQPAVPTPAKAAEQNVSPEEWDWAQKLQTAVKEKGYQPTRADFERLDSMYARIHPDQKDQAAQKPTIGVLDYPREVVHVLAKGTAKQELAFCDDIQQAGQDLKQAYQDIKQGQMVDAAKDSLHAAGHTLSALMHSTVGGVENLATGMAAAVALPFNGLDAGAEKIAEKLKDSENLAGKAAGAAARFLGGEQSHEAILESVRQAARVARQESFIKP